MTDKHTPGPWHVGIKQAEQIVYTKNGWAVANATVYHGNQDRDETKANARLIAEAPAMLDALQDFPQPGLPGGDDWPAQVAQWWNLTARPILARTGGAS
ncbi:MAG: hypothetical protein HQ511_10580 [Rhodospirillales bacterium]|nr:hypothetical protein [Rhodospirillales bacterium]